MIQEAVVLDINPQATPDQIRYLFVLRWGEAERFYRALGWNSGNRGEKLDKLARMQGTTITLPLSRYPLIVAFQDIDDPTSVMIPRIWLRSWVADIKSKV